MDVVVQNAVDAAALGSLYALFALGIALIFGVMRLVNFAHGELVMAGAYALVLIPLPAVLLIPVTIAIVIALALVMERVAFRTVRDASPATLLVTSFALSVLLQSLATLVWGSPPRTTDFASGLSSPIRVGGVAIAKVDVVIVGVTLGLLALLALGLTRTAIGTQTRAAAEDFRLARVVGVRAGTVVAVAFAVSGALAAAAAILLVAKTGVATPTMGVNVVLFAFVATIAGGMGSLHGAAVGGFVLGALTHSLQATLPLEVRPYRDAFVFAAVLVVLVVRPEGLLPARATLARETLPAARLAGAWQRLHRPARPRLRAPVPPSGAGRRGGAEVLRATLAPPAVLVALTWGLALAVWALGPDSLDRVVVGAVINLVFVVGLYAFTGVSGVFSFGHAAFMAIGAYAGAILVMPPDTKRLVLPDLPDALTRVHLDPLSATLAAGGIAAAVALVLAAPLARLSGLTAGLATFAVLSIVNTVARNWQQLTHGTGGVAAVPTETSIWSALGWATVAMTAVWAFQRSATGLRLRATRDDERAARALGIGVTRERSAALVLSAFLVGVAGAIYGMFIGSFNPDAFYLGVTFLTVAMLIVGGMSSLTGAVTGTIVISAIAEILRRVEEGASVGGLDLPSRPGIRDVGLALVMLVILIARPSGVTGGRELSWPARPAGRRGRRGPDRDASAAVLRGSGGP